GVYTITVTGFAAHDTASATFTVTTNTPTITLSPTGGPSGTGVTVAGTGFSTADAGSCLPFIQSPTVPTLFATPACTIASSGQLTGSSFVVASPITPGTYVVSVKGSSGDIASANF